MEFDLGSVHETESIPLTEYVTRIFFEEWIKGAGKDAEAKREKAAKELVDAQESQETHPVTSQATSVNTPGSIANLTRTLEMLSRKHEPKS